jgi:hypothetical protein
VDRERAFGAAALFVLAILFAAGAATADKDEDCGVGDRSCVLDERAGTYGIGVGVGSRVAELRAALGEPEETSGGFAPAGRRPVEVGVPISIPYPRPGPPRRTMPPVYRYDDLAFLVFRGRVFSFMVTAEKAETTRGVGVGDSLDQAREAFPRTRCGDAVAGEPLFDFQTTPTYPYCRAVLGPQRFIWFGEDPIESITITDYSRH